MNINLLSAMIDNVRVVKVKFSRSDTKMYSYLTTDSSIKVGDIVAVKTPEGFIKTVEVFGLADFTVRMINSGLKYQFIVQKIDMSEYNAINKSISKMAKAIEKRADSDIQYYAEDRIQTEYGLFNTVSAKDLNKRVKRMRKK